VPFFPGGGPPFLKLDGLDDDFAAFQALAHSATAVDIRVILKYPSVSTN